MFRFNSRRLALCVLTVVVLVLALPVVAQATTYPLPALNGTQSGPQNSSGSRVNFYRVSPTGFVPAWLPAGQSAVLTATLFSDQWAGTWSSAGGIYEFGVTNDPTTYNTNYLKRDGIAFQDNTNGLGFCWVDYETVSGSGFGAGQCGYADNLYGSLTRFTLTVHADGSFDMKVEHLTPGGALQPTSGTLASNPQTSSDPALRGFDPNLPLFAYIKAGIGSDSQQAWSFEITGATMTVDPAAVYPRAATPAVVETPPPPPAPRCVDMIGEDGTTVIAGAANDSVRNAAYCRQLVKSGQYMAWYGSAITGIANMGDAMFQQTGIQQAVDVFTPNGERAFDGGLAVCLKGSGEFVWASAEAAPRAFGGVASYPSPDYAGFNCVTVFGPGTLALMGQTPVADASAITVGSTAGGSANGTATGSTDPIQ